MPNGIPWPGWRAVLLGAATSLAEADIFRPLEEGVPEGGLMLARLDLADYASVEALAELNQHLADYGVEPWPGAAGYVSADPVAPSIYIAWSKGLAWWPVIGGLLAVTVLPALLGAFVWWILPEEITSVIEAMVMLGVMMLMLYLVSQFMKPLAEPEKPKPVKGAER